MSKKLFGELEKRVNSTYDDTVVIMRGEKDRAERIKGRNQLGAVVSRVRFHEFLVGVPHTDILMFILARTIPFGKVFSIIRDLEFISGIPEVMRGCGMSERSLQYAKKELLQRHLIRTIVLYQGKKRLGTAYALSPIDIIKQGMQGFRKLPEWRRVLLLGLCEFFGAFIYMPTILRVNERGEVLDDGLNREDAGESGSEACTGTSQEEREASKEKEIEETHPNIVHQFLARGK